MSHVKELADAEAARVEAELGTDDPEPTEPEPTEPEPTEPEPSVGGPTDADLRKFEAENTRHEKALAKIIGGDWSEFEACGVCGGVGHLPAAANVGVPFERDPQTEPCEACKGYGTTLTGAKEPGMVTRACSVCQGAGWTTVQEYPNVQPIAFGSSDPNAAPVENGAPAAPVDPVVAELRARGYIIVDPPTVVPAPGS